MPNWCSNKIQIFGDTDKMAPIINTIKRGEENKELLIMETLLGTDDRPENYREGGWYDYNVNKFGCKWDFTYEDMIGLEMDDDSIVFSVDTAWSPPDLFLVNLCETYDVKANITYSEPGVGFYGRSDISKGNYTTESCNFYEGVYKYGDNFWDEVEYQAQNVAEYGGDLEEFMESFNFDMSDEDRELLKQIFEEAEKEEKNKE